MLIYDDEGRIYYNGSESSCPENIYSICPDPKPGYILTGIDTTKTPHEPIYIEIPKPEIEVIKQENIQQQADIDYIMLLLE